MVILAVVIKGDFREGEIRGQKGAHYGTSRAAAVSVDAKTGAAGV
jgi:hypothetical protein